MLLGILLLLGVLGRVVVAYATYGVQYDIASMEVVGKALANDPFDVYSATASANEFLPRWPYPPGFFPWIHFSGLLEAHLGLPAHGTYQLPQILADAGIAALVYIFLGRRGCGDSLRLLAATIVVLGPTFAATSGYHGQIDSVAILPAVAALVVWDRSSSPVRWVGTGALLGVGAAIKTVPLLMLLPLLARARSRAEGLKTAVLAFAIPGLMLVPFFIADGWDVLNVGANVGLPGLGGLSVVVQPGAPDLWLSSDPSTSISELNQWLYDANKFIAIATVACLAGFLFRYRPSPVQGAVVAWLAVYVINPDVMSYYLVWGMPFFLMAGYIRQAAVLQTVMIIPTIIAYGGPWSSDLVPQAYAAVMIALWVWAAVALAVLVARIIRAGPAGTRRLLETRGADGSLSSAAAR